MKFKITVSHESSVGLDIFSQKSPRLRNARLLELANIGLHSLNVQAYGPARPALSTDTQVKSVITFDNQVSQVEKPSARINPEINARSATDFGDDLLAL